MKKQKYICIAKGKEQFNYKGESMGMGNDRALYYSRSLGRGRVYRSSYPTPPVNPKNDFRLLSFVNQENAHVLCSQINAVYNDCFIAIEQTNLF